MMESIARLASGVAHDFNNILSVISICADEALASMPLDAPARECLIDIRHAVERGSFVTRDLLTFSRRDIQEPRLVDFNDVVSESHRALARLLGDDISLKISLSAANARVRLDPAHWSSVLTNLALNARQAMTNGGSLTIRTRDVEIDPATFGRPDRPPGRYIELEVVDDGCGMPAHVQSKIFEPFFTTKGSIATGRTGLGLSVVHGVVERANGFIEVTSRMRTLSKIDDEPSGTTFRIFIPCESASPTVLGASSESPHSASFLRSSSPRRAELTLLVVEDEDAVRRVAQKTLERAGFRVLSAPSGEDAIAMLDEIDRSRSIEAERAEAESRQAPFDLLVTDVMLPGMNGRQLADALRARYEHTLVLYTSGFTDDDMLRLGIHRSELRFLPKPYTTKVLVTLVRDMLGVKVDSEEDISEAKSSAR